MITYTFHKFNDVPRKYSKQIEEHLLKQPDFIQSNNLDKYYWSDKNSKSILQDYYPFPIKSIIDKKYLYQLHPTITIPTYTSGNIESFIKNDKHIVYYLKPADKYIGGSNGITISNDIDELCHKFIKGKYIIQKEIIPDLINGYKYDIRIYVLIVYNHKSVHIYVYPGILRFCKEKYEMNSTDSNKQITIHGEFERMKEINKEIKYIVYNTLLDIYPQKNKVGYQYLGYDIIIDKNKKYHLIEVNIQPCLERIHYKIIDDFSKLVARPISTNQGVEPFMYISTYDIFLSELNHTHLDDLYEITSNINVMQYIGNLKIWTFEKTKKFIEYKNDDNYYFMGIIMMNKLIGIIGRDRKNLTIYLNPKYSNRGYGTLSLHLFTNIVKLPLNADVLIDNTISNKLFKKYKCIKRKNINTYVIE